MGACDNQDNIHHPLVLSQGSYSARINLGHLTLLVLAKVRISCARGACAVRIQGSPEIQGYPLRDLLGAWDSPPNHQSPLPGIITGLIQYTKNNHCWPFASSVFWLKVRIVCGLPTVHFGRWFCHSTAQKQSCLFERESMAPTSMRTRHTEIWLATKEKHFFASLESLHTLNCTQNQ